jgi:hypothetical protein
MNKISAAKQVFRTINEELDRATTGDETSRRLIIQKLKTINEELSDVVVELMKKTMVYEQGRSI